MVYNGILRPQGPHPSVMHGGKELIPPYLAQPQPQSALEKELLDQIASPLPLSFPTHQASSQEYPVDRSTSISQVRNEMFQQLKKLRSSFQAGQR